MIEPGNIPEAVQWHEGMLLAPQHFQQAWLRSEALLGYTLGNTGLFPWGVRRVAFDRALLAGGKVRVLALEAVMPDGLAVLHPRDDDALLEIDLAEVKDALTQAPMAVHVTVPMEVARPEPGQLHRWLSVRGRPVADSNTGEGDLPIARLRPALSLALTESPLVPPQRRLVSLPIARVAFRDDAFMLEPFAPPRTDLPADGELGVLCREVAQRLREKASSLGERLQTAGAEGRELPGGDMAESLRSIVAVLPRLEGLVQAEAVHPFHAYLALCDLSGVLSWLGGQPVPPPPPLYRHDDALPAFESLAGFALRMLSRIRETYRTLRFQRLADGRFALPLDAALLAGGSLVVGARAAAGMAPSETADWMARALIGSTPAMKTIAERRVRGAARQRVESAEEFGLVPPASMVLMRVAADSAFVVAGQPLEVVGPAGGGAPVEVVLFAAEPSARPGKPAAAPR